MRVFVTGATGFVGSAVVTELLNAGHQVLGLARNDKAAGALTDAGAEVHRGDLEDLDSLTSGARATDAVIHCGFIHDFSRFKEVCEVDRVAINILGAALLGTDKPLIVTSGIGLLSHGKVGVETDMPQPGPNPRIASEEAVDALAAQGVRVAVVRLPPSVHGVGDHGFVPILINIAREKGVSVYKGDGQNQWPAVHRVDAATLYRLAIEKSWEPGRRFHAVDEQGVPFKEIAAVIGKHLNIPVESKPEEEAAAYFGWFAHFAGFNCPASSQLTRDYLGWGTTQPGLIKDVDQDAYFIA